jgi:hypothetical protein
MAVMVRFHGGGRLQKGRRRGGGIGRGRGKEEEAEQHLVEGGERRRRPSGVRLREGKGGGG